MRSHHLTRAFILLLIPVIATPQAVKVIQLSNFIGDTIDVSENTQFALYPHVMDFHSAVMFISNDSMLLARVCIVRNGMAHDTVIRDNRSLSFLRNQISQILFNSQKGDARDPTARIVLEDNQWRDDDGIILDFRTWKQAFRGEVLSLRGDSIIIASSVDGFHVVHGALPAVVILHRHDIYDISTIGKRQTLLGLILGAMLGVSVSYYYFNWSDRHRSSWWSENFQLFESLAAFGLPLVGVVIGYSIRSGERRILGPSDDKSDILSQYARYRREEPPFMRTMFPR
jgi:hypothetical protein